MMWDTELFFLYFLKTGRITFTYDQLRRFYYGSGLHKKYKKDWHSIERIIRKMCEQRTIIKRWKQKGRTWIFLIKPEWLKKMIELKLKDLEKKEIKHWDLYDIKKLAEEKARLKEALKKLEKWTTPKNGYLPKYVFKLPKPF